MEAKLSHLLNFLWLGRESNCYLFLCRGQGRTLTKSIIAGYWEEPWRTLGFHRKERKKRDCRVVWLNFFMALLATERCSFTLSGMKSWKDSDLFSAQAANKLIDEPNIPSPIIALSSGQKAASETLSAFLCPIEKSITKRGQKTRKWLYSISLNERLAHIRKSVSEDF